MQIVIIGVVKKFTLLWFKGPKMYRLGTDTRQVMSRQHYQVAPFICSKFNRKPRSFGELERWTATGFRLLLLYSGPVIFSEHLPREMYRNSMSPHVALTILSSPNFCPTFSNYSEELLRYLVEILWISMEKSVFLTMFTD